MKLAALALALLVAACAAPPAPTPSRAIALRNAGFEGEITPDARCPPAWGCSVHADPGAYRFTVDESSPAEGRRSLRVEQVRNEPWAIATQHLRTETHLRGARLRFSMALKLEGVTGKGAGPFYLAQGTGGTTLDHRQSLLQGTSGWQRVTLEFVVPEGSEGFQVGLAIEGPGRAWIDDARLEWLETGSKP